jgi:hypothetical protein
MFDLRMKRLPSFRSFLVTPGSRVTGALTTYTFAFVSGQEMITDHKLVIDLTRDIWYGDGTVSTTVICLGDGKILTGVTCSVESICLTDLADPNAAKFQSGRFTATLTFANNLIPVGTAFSFTLKDVKNAPFTLPITVKDVKILDQTDEAVIQEYSIKPFPTIVMKQAAEISEKSVSLDFQTVGRVTSLQITFKTVNRMPSTANLVVGYP